MSPDRPQRWAAHLVAIAALLAAAPALGAGDVGVSAPDARRSSTDAGDASASPSAPSADTAGGDAGLRSTAAERLERDHDLPTDELDSASALAERRDAAKKSLARLESRVGGLEDELAVQRSKLEALVDQANSLSPAGAAAFVPGIAHHRVVIARLEGAIDHVRTLRGRRRRIVELLETRIATLRAGESATPEQRRSAERAKRAEREAKRAIQTAQRRRERERDRRLDELNARLQEIAEKRLASTRQFQEEIRELRSETSEIGDGFAQREAELVDRIARLPRSPTGTERRDRIDPVFRRLVEIHREELAAHRDAVRARQSAASRVERAQQRLREARSGLRQTRRQRRDYEDSTLWSRRVEVDEARVDLRRQELDEARDRLRERKRRARMLREQLASIESSMRQLLPRISEQAHDSYYRLFDRHNWSVALDNIGYRVRGMYDDLRRRGDQLAELADDPFAISTWTILGGLAWRLLVLVLLLRYLFPAIPALARETTSWLLERSFFRHRPAMTVKLVDSLAAVVRPLSVYLVVLLVGGYLARILPELEVVLWAVDAIFLYWVAIGLLAALISPGERRAEPVETPEARAPDSLRSTPVEEARAAADLTGMDRPRAEKFLRSGRVVLAFWILAAYIPDFVAEFTGPTVLLYVVEQFATWGFVLVVYWVLSTWRDDISELFTRLADPRLDRAAAFVRSHKDRPWGVVVIGLASLYVLFVESVRLARKYLLGAEWFQSVTEFAFQKSVELQQSSGDAGDGPARESKIPGEYTAQFADAPLQPGDERMVERDTELREVLEQYDEWCDRRRQGSVAIVGESGVGRTTLMMRIEARLEADAGDDEPPRIVDLRMGGRFVDAPDLLNWLAEAFELDSTFESPAALAEALQAVDSRVVLLDDCENAFLRRTGGFDALRALFDVVALTDETHFWVLSFHRFAWSYINRIRERSHYFGAVVEISPWSEAEIRQYIERRNEASEIAVSFRALDAGERDEGVSSRFVDVVQASAGYFRYLSTFAEGNPRVAATYWLRSLEYEPHRDRLHVHLFRRPPTEPLADLGDDYWFALTALAQHSELDARELADATNLELDFCIRALDYFDEVGVVAVDPVSERARLSPLYFRQILNHLSSSNFLCGWTNE